MNIITKPVGQTDLSVTSLSFGCASIGNLGGVVRDADATAVMQHAWDAGIRYFDTAPTLRARAVRATHRYIFAD